MSDPFDPVPPRGPLVGVAEVQNLIDEGRRPHLLDVRWKLGGPPGLSEFRAGHIPGAVYVDLDVELAAPAAEGQGRHPLPPIEALQGSARAWGLSDGESVVVYDDNAGLAAARAWWLLRWAGLTDVRLLDGGLAAWRAAGGPVVTGDEPAPEPGNVALSPGHLPVVDPDGAEQLVASGGLLLDARAGERFRGEPNPIDPQFGHIPGAVSAPTTENVSADGMFRSAEELADRFAALGVRPDRPVGVYCGSGVTAAHELAALAVAGVEHVVLYPGSWSQWATLPDRPVETGAGVLPAPLIPAEEGRRRVAAGAVLLDTRSPGGREKGGAIDGAIVVDRENLEAEFSFGSPTRHPEVESVKTPIVVVCGSVNGSGPVAEWLLQHGFEDVAHVKDGAAAWHAAGPG